MLHGALQNGMGPSLGTKSADKIRQIIMWWHSVPNQIFVFLNCLKTLLSRLSQVSLLWSFQTELLLYKIELSREACWFSLTDKLRIKLC